MVPLFVILFQNGTHGVVAGVLSDDEGLVGVLNILNTVHFFESLQDSEEIVQNGQSHKWKIQRKHHEDIHTHLAVQYISFMPVTWRPCGYCGRQLTGEDKLAAEGP